MTIRRRGGDVLKRLQNVPKSEWHDVVIDIPRHRHQKISDIDEFIKLPGYDGEIRQIAATGLGQKHPTLSLTNNIGATIRDLVTNYARRIGVEVAIGSNIHFFPVETESDRRIVVYLDRRAHNPILRGGSARQKQPQNLW